MSRNLDKTICAICSCAVEITGAPYVKQFPLGPAEEAGYLTVVVADAECKVCGAKYSAWLNEPHRQKSVAHRMHPTGGFYDLSFRASFNDEPGEGDAPNAGKVTRALVVRINNEIVHEEPAK